LNSVWARHAGLPWYLQLMTGLELLPLFGFIFGFNGFIFLPENQMPIPEEAFQ